MWSKRKSGRDTVKMCDRMARWLKSGGRWEERTRKIILMLVSVSVYTVLLI